MEEQILDYELQEDNEPTLEPRYAGFWVRVVASILDALVLLPVGIFTFFSLIYFNSLPLYVLSVIISGLYKPFCEYKFGATLGKMVIDLKVTSEDYQSLSLEQSFIRSSPFLLNTIASILLIFLVFDANTFDKVNGFFELGT